MSNRPKWMGLPLMAVGPFLALREQLSGLWVRAKDAFEQRQQRERVLIVAAGATLAVFIVALTAFMIISALDDLATHNGEVSEALRLVAREGETFRMKRRAEQNLDILLSRPAPGLQKFLDDVATKLNGGGKADEKPEIKIGESTELAVVPRGNKYQSRSVELKLREVELKPLVAFLRDVESSPHKIIVERIGIKPRYGQHEKLDVELKVTAFERAEKKEKKGSGKGGKGSSGSGSGSSSEGSRRGG